MKDEAITRKTKDSAQILLVIQSIDGGHLFS